MNYKRLIPAAVWGLLIFFIISWPESQLPDPPLLKVPGIDKLVHLFLFFVLSLLIAYGLYRQNPKTRAFKHLSMITLLIGIAYGASTELLQHFAFSSRHGSINDFFANGIGTIFGLLSFRHMIEPRLKKQGFIK